ncbi:ATP/GTP-binding protein [Methanocalculus sp.]|uniref:AAA family ATPase n=1 Tax=Methanocalculus sp. TaxID=2004547 RepID=UPI0027198BB0|nr:ATP-binding protein [Methanocalculus sp.]MDO8840969.1 AAA family ATPase [Methanocalculus sp.]
MLLRIIFERFTAFDHLEIEFSPGINIFIGKNGTGKTHILKALYAASDITRSQKSLGEKITRVFLPSGEQTGRLVKRSAESSRGYVGIYRRVKDRKEEIAIQLSLSNHTRSYESARTTGDLKQWMEAPLDSAYIPVKDMMANAPGFRSLYNMRHIHFEEVYADIIDRAYLGTLKGPMDKNRKNLLAILQNAMDGKVITKKEEFFLKNKQGELEFTLLAEGFRKLALLWMLIQNGTLSTGSVLFWDEPETNLNPALMKTVINILVELQRNGVQIFLSTHDYVILKELDLQIQEEDRILYHSLYRNVATDEIEIKSTSRYQDVEPNAIDETFGDLVRREIERTLGVVAD